MAGEVTKQNKQACAPLRLRVILPTLAAIVLLGAAVCLLHWENAVSLRGEAKISEYAMVNAEDENLILILHEPWQEEGVMHISGALLRPGQNVGGVNVRVALLPQKLEAGQPAQMDDAVILLNTQMVRRQDYAAEYDADDHCGFHAAADVKRLWGDGYQYRVALADETGVAKNLIETDMTVTPIEGGLAFARVHAPESEEAHAQ